MVAQKNCISERGFDNCMTKQIRSRNWELFTKQPLLTMLLIVQEFYAKDYGELKVFVREKWIPFDRASINKFYKT